MKTTVKIAELRASDDSGNEHILEVWQEFHDVTSSAGFHRIPGNRSITCDGDPVNLVSDGVYEIVRLNALTNLIVQSSDPLPPPLKQ
jgi:hypothetical protein